MKILNLYAGIGGNRKLWGDEHEITAIELNPKIAKIYQDFFPKDKMIITDAHQYLLEHFGGYDFIWSSPPCITHSKINVANILSPYKDNRGQLKHGGGINPRYPDLKLYEEIIFLRHFCKRKWCVENIVSYYFPLIQVERQINRHFFWANFKISYIKVPFVPIDKNGDKIRAAFLGVDLKKYKTDIRKDAILRNCINPDLGLHILNESQRDIQGDLFK